MFVYKVKTRTFVSISILSFISAMCVVIGAKYFVSAQYFIIPQIIFGILFGICSGIGYTGSNIISQQWMDKKRSQLNPFLMIGGPMTTLFVAPLFTWLCAEYTWSGACIITIGFVSHGLIVVILFAKHPGNYLALKKEV